MSTVTAYKSLWMLDWFPWYGQLAVTLPKMITMIDYSGSVGDFYGTFKFANGDIASGTVNRYNFFESDLKFTITGLNLNAKVVENLVITGNQSLLWALALKGNDTIIGSDANDELYGFDGNDKIYGGEGDVNRLYGGLGNDKIYGGGNAHNLIYGGDGKDTLTGGYNWDAFHFDTKLGNSNIDTITDFKSGLESGIEDFLGLDTSIFKSLTPYQSPYDNLVIGTKALDENDYLIFNPKTHTLSYDADGSGAGKAIAFVVLTGVATIDAYNIQPYSLDA
jgi:Ca2+-binding RTX toxin-like protein